MFNQSPRKKPRTPLTSVPHRPTVELINTPPWVVLGEDRAAALSTPATGSKKGTARAGLPAGSDRRVKERLRDSIRKPLPSIPRFPSQSRQPSDTLPPDRGPNICCVGLMTTVL